MMRSNKLVAVLVTTFLGAIGCGPTATTVSGTVTYNGEPVEQGAITFRPADGQGQSFGAQIVDGAYTTAAGSPGSRTAVVMGVKKIDFGMSSDEAMRKADEAQAAGKPWGGHLSEPADYIAEDAEGNSQTVEITPGHQTLNIEVKGPPKP
jgi:hypothetical protein